MRRIVACGLIALSLAGVTAVRASADPKPPAWNAAQVGDVTVAPNPVPRGTKYAVVVKVKNTGDAVWRPEDVYTTVVTVGGQAVSVSPTSVIKPGETFEIAVELTARGEPGTQFIDITMRHRDGPPHTITFGGQDFDARPNKPFGPELHAQVTVAAPTASCSAGGSLAPTCTVTAPGTIGMVQTSGVGTFMVADLTTPQTVLTGVGPTTTPLTFTTSPGDQYQLTAGPNTTLTLG
jgi:hypothetical protein